MTRALSDYRLAQAKQALRDNAALAKLPPAQRKAAIWMEMYLARVMMTQRAWEQNEPRWGLEL